MIQWRGGSAVITMASQRCRRASSTIRLAACRVPRTWPEAVTPRRLSAATASATIRRCSSHSRLLGSSPGFGSPKDVPQTRAIDRTWTTAVDRPAMRAAKSTAVGAIARPSEASRTDRITSAAGSGGSCSRPHGLLHAGPNRAGSAAISDRATALAAVTTLLKPAACPRLGCGTSRTAGRRAASPSRPSSRPAHWSTSRTRVRRTARRRNRRRPAAGRRTS